jgi:hypothetical protein
MKLLNTIVLPNQLAAQGINHVAIYQNGAVSTYLKDKINSKLTATGPTTAVPNARTVRISPSGEYIGVQSDTKTVRIRNGVQESFDNNVGSFGIADTGHIVMIALASGAVQVIDSSVTNLTVAVTDDDRVVCAKGRYMVYNRARTITANYTDLVLTPVASAKEIVYVTHDHNGKFVVFYSDNTFSYDGAAAKTFNAPAQGFRDVGDQILCTDMKNDWALNHSKPQAFPELVRKFKWTVPADQNTDFASLRLMAPGSGFTTANFDLKNGVVVQDATDVTSVSDSPYGVTGKSLSFNGTTSNLRTADSANITLGAADFTIELFVKINSGTTSITTLVQKGGGATIAWPSFLLQAVVASKAFCFAASFNNTGADVGTFDGPGAWGAFEFDVWTHIAITRKGNTWRCFQDGKLRAKYTGNGTLFPNTGRGITIGGSRGTNYTSGALYGQLKGNVNGFQILNYAKYTHDFYAETLSTTPALPSNGVPGAGSPIAGDTTLGYYGTATGTALITGDALATAVGLSAGVSVNSDTPWFKFASNGKILFIPKLPIRSNISWPQLYAAGLVYGLNSGIGPFPLPTDATVQQTKRVTINGNVYKVRLMTGGNADPYPSGEFNVSNPANALNSEYTQLVQRCWALDPNGAPWDNLSMEEMGIDGVHIMWCQESHPNGPFSRVHRGISGPAGFGTTDGNYTDVGGYTFMWRPVLELVGPA